jgi:2-polyprenyl-3-methyl-5-hydroxy-6-metoxy-1,4-benzoquinol methylase
MRDFNKEFFDNRAKYAYNFDFIMRKYMMKAFLPFMLEGKALEMGCYKGDFTEKLLEYYQDLTVIEAASELAEFTTSRLGSKVKMINSTFEEVETEEKYDAIFFMHTLEHVDDAVDVLKRVNSWLSDKGRLFLVVPNGNAPSRQIAVKMGLISHNTAITDSEFEHGHRRTYVLDTLEKDALLANLNVIHRGGIVFKALANFQMDKLLELNIIDEKYIEGCYKLGMEHPHLCASIFLVCEKGYL